MQVRQALPQGAGAERVPGSLLPHRTDVSGGLSYQIFCTFLEAPAATLQAGRASCLDGREARIEPAVESRSRRWRHHAPAIRTARALRRGVAMYLVSPAELGQRAVAVVLEERLHRAIHGAICVLVHRPKERGRTHRRRFAWRPVPRGTRHCRRRGLRSGISPAARHRGRGGHPCGRSSGPPTAPR